MADSVDLRKDILTAQERFDYFFLTADGSAIAFALLRTESQQPAAWMIPIALAVVCWGVSFYLGCEHLLFKLKVILGNLRFLEIKEGSEPHTAANPALAEQAQRRLRENAEGDNEKSRTYGRRMYKLFLLGAVFYVVAHVQRLLS